MTTGHILPGYNDPVTRLRRVQNIGYPIESDKILQLRQETSLDRNEFELIRAKAREIWSKPDREKTTYNFYHTGDKVGEFAPARPSSATRKNKPHPPLVFLTNRLHHITGYQQPDTTCHTQAYRVDASVPFPERAARQLTRSKYIGRPSTVSINQYRDQYHLKDFMEPTPAQATEAWLNWAGKDEKEHALSLLEDQRNQFGNNGTYGDPSRAKSAIPSTYRWMKYSGPYEHSKLYGSDHQPNYPPVTNTLPYSMDILGLRRSILHPPKQPKLRFHSARGDYSIHPDWPPSIPHHCVP
ncbi:hypothetical protein SNE40_016263 [Patella caerulea]|uniref:Uncharacterized protein n=1 Tax=Patella caerulea TaxID=87958 RepID=A0AAN8PBV6_PATCE